MFRSMAVVLALLLAVPSVPPPAEAQTQKKSQQKKAEKKSKKKTEKKKSANKGRSDYTAEQRASMMKRAREVCRKSFGAPSTVYRIDYKSMRVYCWRPGS